MDHNEYLYRIHTDLFVIPPVQVLEKVLLIKEKFKQVDHLNVPELVHQVFLSNHMLLPSLVWYELPSSHHVSSYTTHLITNSLTFYCMILIDLTELWLISCTYWINFAILMLSEHWKCFFPLTNDDTSSCETAASFLILTMKDMGTFKKLAILELL